MVYNFLDIDEKHREIYLHSIRMSVQCIKTSVQCIQAKTTLLNTHPDILVV